MQSSFNKKETRPGALQELIKSPQQVKTIVRKSAVTDCVVALPFHYSKGTAEELVFSRMSFCEDFSIRSLSNNKLLILENCVFHRTVTLDAIKNVKIIIRNCHFMDTLQITNLESCMIELYGTSHNQDAVLSNIKVDTFFTSDVDMKKQNMLQLVNSSVSNFMNHSTSIPTYA